MKTTSLLLLLLLSIALVSGAIVAIPESPNNHGQAHEVFSTIHSGGSGLERHGSVLLFGWLLGLLVVGTIVTGFALGLQRKEKVGPLRTYLTIGGIIYGVLFSVLFLTYFSYIQGDETPQLFGFPLPTAIMLFALWPMPVYFIVLYVWGFDRYIVTSQDLERFKETLNRRRKGD
ncbi:MAG: hypothetical protein DF168_00172 [Candidatus Moanabacter tarae]|uniref:Uncharacterized protein n=1 Tax=Candidatus Moanibacter tarae TaxID=2200854 RepID=A0A2Z4AKA0_9BACT|nr:MAG: hypothetical protein DF168_00172 [Candidatus Moanabacter tarae]